MDRSEQLTLIASVITNNEYGVQVEQTEERTIFCQVESVSATEFFDGGRNGLNPAYRFTVFFDDYQGELMCRYKGKQYAIYRTFLAKGDNLELYAERQGGTNG